MRFDARQIAGLCNGSTPDSDSVCEGSNPSPAAKNRLSIGQPVFYVFCIFQTVKELSSQKLRREEKCERKPSGFPFASNNPPQRQNCKIMIQKLILQFGKQLGEKAQRDFFDKLTQRKRSGLRVQKASQSSPPAGGEKSEIIFSGGVYVGENTAQPASVRIARL